MTDDAQAEIDANHERAVLKVKARRTYDEGPHAAEDPTCVTCKQWPYKVRRMVAICKLAGRVIGPLGWCECHRERR